MIGWHTYSLLLYCFSFMCHFSIVIPFRFYILCLLHILIYRIQRSITWYIGKPYKDYGMQVLNVGGQSDKNGTASILMMIQESVVAHNMIWTSSMYTFCRIIQNSGCLPNRFTRNKSHTKSTIMKLDKCHRNGSHYGAIPNMVPFVYCSGWWCSIHDAIKWD